MEFIMGFMWNSHGLHMGFIWDSHGIHMEFIWNSYGIHMEFIRISYGIHIEFIWHSKSCVFAINMFFTNGVQDRDLGLRFGASGSELCHGTFSFSKREDFVEKFCP